MEQESSVNPKKKTGFLVVVVIIILVGAFFLVSPFGSFGVGVDRGKWQAVFLANNQVYFGHVVTTRNDFVELRDVFYLQAVQPLQQGAAVPPPAFSLIKLGGELHGPTDAMYIPKNNVLFLENMRDDSQIVGAIQQYTSKQSK